MFGEHSMNEPLAIVLAFLAAAIAMFVINRPRMDAVALIMLTALPFTGVLTMNEALAGFGDSNVVLIAAMFVIGGGLVRTGVARQLGDWLTARAGNSEVRLIVLLMLVVCGLSSMMSSTAATAIFIPVVLRCGRSIGSAPSRLMMPLSFAALISGMTTLVATPPNLVVNGELIRHGETGFRFFTFMPFGIPILILGILYMIYARRWLPAGNDSIIDVSNRPSLTDWVSAYKLADRVYRLRVKSGSSLVGHTLNELNLRESGANVIAIERARHSSTIILKATGDTEVEAGDIVLMDLTMPRGEAEGFQQRFALESLALSDAFFAEIAQEIGMVEVIVPADSKLIGRTIVEIKLRARLGLTVIGLRRGKSAWEKGLLQEHLKVGDILLVMGPWRSIRKLKLDETGVLLLNLPVEFDEVLPVTRKAPHAIFALTVVIVLMVFGIVPNVQAALIGCLLMGLLGCIDLNSAYGSIDWKTIVLIVGMLPFSIALERTGGVTLMADGLMAAIGGAGPYGILGCLFLITTLLGMFISNTATAVLMAPVAIALAKDLHASPYPFGMIVALAASTAFITPVSSPVNTLVVTPGNYTFGDFVRVGAPFALIVMTISVLMVPWLLPF
jgi:di/tricarboxylate transporter